MGCLFVVLGLVFLVCFGFVFWVVGVILLTSVALVSWVLVGYFVPFVGLVGLRFAVTMDVLFCDLVDFDWLLWLLLFVFGCFVLFCCDLFQCCVFHLIACLFDCCV